MGVQQIIVRHALMLLSVALIGLAACKTRPPAALSGSDEPVIQSVRVDGEPRVGQIVTVTVEILSSRAEPDVWLTLSVPEDNPIAVFLPDLIEQESETGWIPRWVDDLPEADNGVDANSIIGTPTAPEFTVPTPSPQDYVFGGVHQYLFDRVELASATVSSHTIKICVLQPGTWIMLVGYRAFRSPTENLGLSQRWVIVSDIMSGAIYDEIEWSQQGASPIQIEISPSGEQVADNDSSFPISAEQCQ